MLPFDNGCSPGIQAPAGAGWTWTPGLGARTCSCDVRVYQDWKSETHSVVAVEFCLNDGCPGRLDTSPPGPYDELVRACDGPTECHYEWFDQCWESTISHAGFAFGRNRALI